MEGKIAKHSFRAELHRIITPEISSDSCYLSVEIGVIPKETRYFSLNYSDGFSNEDNHQCLYEQFGDIVNYSFYAQGCNGGGWGKVVECYIFFKVVE